jgi:hypothetical protein
MKTAEEKRKDPCYGDLRCWNWIQIRCPVYEECLLIAGSRKCDRHTKKREMA